MGRHTMVIKVWTGSVTGTEGLQNVQRNGSHTLTPPAASWTVLSAWMIRARLMFLPNYRLIVVAVPPVLLCLSCPPASKFHQWHQRGTRAIENLILHVDFFSFLIPPDGGLPRPRWTSWASFMYASSFLYRENLSISAACSMSLFSHLFPPCSDNLLELQVISNMSTCLSVFSCLLLKLQLLYYKKL